MMAAPPAPFVFVGCHELRENLGRRAFDERELMEALEQVPAGSVGHHVFGGLLRHRHAIGPYVNDFASWVALHVRDQVLGERLAALDPFDCADLERLREGLISIIHDHLSRLLVVPRVVYGEPFCFVQSHLAEVPTMLEARTLLDFRNGLAEVDPSALYYHIAEARLRGRRTSDFAAWLRDALGRPDLAEQVERVDVYFLSLERVRAQILTILDSALASDLVVGA